MRTECGGIGEDVARGPSSSEGLYGTSRDFDWGDTIGESAFSGVALVLIESWVSGKGEEELLSPCSSLAAREGVWNVEEVRQKISNLM